MCESGSGQRRPFDPKLRKPRSAMKTTATLNPNSSFKSAVKVSKSTRVLLTTLAYLELDSRFRGVARGGGSGGSSTPPSASVGGVYIYS